MMKLSSLLKKINEKIKFIYIGGGFLTGPPDFQYQNEKQVAANQD